jgi:PAS domain S-box-containing protein
MDHSSTTDEFRTRVFETSPWPIVVMDAETWRFIDCNPAAVAVYGYASKESVIGKTPVDVSAPIQHDGTGAAEKSAHYITEALEKGSTVFEWRHQRPSGETWDAEVHLLSFAVGDRRFLQFSLVDTTDRRLAAQLQRLQHDLVLELNSCSDFEHGLDTVLGAVLKLDRIDCGGIYVVDPADQTLHLAAHRGLSAEFIAEVAHPPTNAPSAGLAFRGEILYGTYAELLAEESPVRRNEGLRGFAVIPITSKGTLIALMNLSSRTSDSIPVRTRTALETIAFQVGTSLLRLRTEATLRETESMFQQFLEKSPVHVYFKDHDLRAIRVSSNFEQLLRRPVKEILGKQSHELFSPALAAAIDADDRAVLAGERTISVDEELNGRHYTTIKFPIHLAGKPAYLAGFTIDITDRKRAEEALRERTAQFQAFMDNVPSMAIIKDEQFRPLYFNKAMLDAFPADWLGKTPHETFPAEIADAMVKTDQRAIDESSVVYEEQWVDKNGTPRVLETKKFAIRRGDLPAHVGAIISDITERKRDEMLLQNAQKLESLGVLAGGIAHDFNNLLGGIFGYLDLAKIEQTEEARQECIGHAMSVMERARDLTRQLLTFAKGGAPVKKVDSLMPFLQNAVQFALSGANIRAQLDVPHDLWPCDYDRNQMAQVIDNIVINAVQAMPAGGTIDVSARNVSFADDQHVVLPAGRYLRISITDHGIGIPRDYLPRIFDPFFTTKQKGHGLGLATCYSIVTRHGGCIEVDSEPGQGSTFRIFLPAASRADAAGTPPSPTRHRGHGTFVVMDDEEVILDMVSGLLRKLGYEVVCFKDGREVLEFYANALESHREIAAMIFDLTIPGRMGGKETIREVCKLGGAPPVFVASGYADDPVMAHPRDYGFTGSIAKPFTSRELSQLLETHLRQSSKHRGQ